MNPNTIHPRTSWSSSWPLFFSGWPTNNLHASTFFYITYINSVRTSQETQSISFCSQQLWSLDQPPYYNRLKFLYFPLQYLRYLPISHYNNILYYFKWEYKAGKWNGDSRGQQIPSIILAFDAILQLHGLSPDMWSPPSYRTSRCFLLTECTALTAGTVTSSYLEKEKQIMWNGAVLYV
jgi:hypothetical protein